MTFYLGIVDRAEDGAFGAVFPDLPGCVAMGDDMNALFANSVDAIRAWVEDAVDRDGGFPEAREHAALMADPEVRDAIKEAGPVGCLIQVPLMLDAGRTVRVTFSIDAALLGSIDEDAKRRGLTRSAFLASAARSKIEKR